MDKTHEQEVEPIEQTDNGWHEGDPVEQPSQGVEVDTDDDC